MFAAFYIHAGNLVFVKAEYYWQLKPHNKLCLTNQSNPVKVYERYTDSPHNDWTYIYISNSQTNPVNLSSETDFVPMGEG